MSHPEPSGPELDEELEALNGELPVDEIPGLDR
jgi:hypothetical protein